MMAESNVASSRPDLSVCIPTWNGRELVLSCLRSVVDGTPDVPLELIVVDNGSSDGTVDAVTREFPGAMVLQNRENEGFPTAVNRGIRVATGRYVVVLNNDVVVGPGALSKMVRVMDDEPSIGMLGCRVVFPDGAVQHTAHDEPCWQDYVFSALFLHRLMPGSARFARIDRTYLDYRPGLVVDTDWLGGVVLVARSEAIARVGLLDERIFAFSEDWDWCRRFVAAGYRVVYWGHAEVVHNHGSSSMRYTGPDRELVREKSILRMTAAALYVFGKHHPGAPVTRLLFQASFRLHCLSRFVVFSVSGRLRPGSSQPGIARGYAKSVFTSYHRLAAEYLRPVAVLPSESRVCSVGEAGEGPRGRRDQ